MNRDDVLGLCASLPGAVEDYPFGDEVAVFKVGGRMFALVTLGGSPGLVNLKCDPALALELRAVHSSIRPGYHANKRHWKHRRTRRLRGRQNAARDDPALLSARRQPPANRTTRPTSGKGTRSHVRQGCHLGSPGLSQITWRNRAGHQLSDHTLGITCSVLLLAGGPGPRRRCPAPPNRPSYNVAGYSHVLREHPSASERLRSGDQRVRRAGLKLANPLVLQP